MNRRFVFKALGCLWILLACSNAQTQADFVTTTSTDFISIPAIGVASPYPTTLNVSGVTGIVTNFTLTMTGVSHNFSDDMAAAIVSPQGTAVLLFSGPGANFLEAGRKNVFNLNWTFDDNATDTLPQSTQPVSGTFRPGLFEYDDSFPAPGPAFGTYGFSFAPYLTEDLNGDWRLFVMDSNSGDSGEIAGGWSMTISFEPNVVPEPSTMILFAGLSGAVGWKRWRVGRNKRSAVTA